MRKDLKRQNFKFVNLKDCKNANAEERKRKREKDFEMQLLFIQNP